jgi:hypothetical protein
MHQCPTLPFNNVCMNVCFWLPGMRSSQTRIHPELQPRRFNPGEFQVPTVQFPDSALWRYIDFRSCQIVPVRGLDSDVPYWFFSNALQIYSYALFTYMSTELPKAFSIDIDRPSSVSKLLPKLLTSKVYSRGPEQSNPLPASFGGRISVNSDSVGCLPVCPTIGNLRTVT